MPDWIGSLAQVAGIAGNLISAFLSEENGSPTVSVDTGQIEWSYVQQSGKPPVVFARNNSNGPTGLTYTVATQNENLSVHQPLDPGNSYDATSDVQAFLDGNVAAAPLDLSADAGGPGARTISFAISSLSLGATVAIIKGITFSYDRTPNGFTASIKTDAVTPLAAEVTARDTTGNQVSANVKLGDPEPTREPIIAPTDGATFEIPLPAGVNLDPVAAQISVLLDVPASFYRNAVQERHARQLSQTPVGAAIG